MSEKTIFDPDKVVRDYNRFLIEDHLKTFGEIKNTDELPPNIMYKVEWNKIWRDLYGDKEIKYPKMIENIMFKLKRNKSKL